MSDTPKRRKPTGNTGPIRLGPDGTIVREWVEFPETKEELELFIATGFCVAGSGYRPHFKRYGEFSNLQRQRENSVDFNVTTGVGNRWLELCEFAPLKQFGGSYDKVSAHWDANRMIELVLSLIEKKARKGYGENVILLIYKTHRTLFIPPPIVRSVRERLKGLTPKFESFESIYCISPHADADMSVWELWPGDPDDQGPVVRDGQIFVGP
jgi:hypothetical protein